MALWNRAMPSPSADATPNGVARRQNKNAGGVNKPSLLPPCRPDAGCRVWKIPAARRR